MLRYSEYIKENIEYGINYLKDSIILYNTAKEAVLIAKKLKNLGFLVYRYNKIESNCKYWDCFIFDGKYFILSSYVHYVKRREHLIRSENFLYSDRIKIKRYDIDPYDEEFWGYEET